MQLLTLPNAKAGGALLLIKIMLKRENTFHVIIVKTKIRRGEIGSWQVCSLNAHFTGQFQFRVKAWILPK
jgi:hypothetical protein